MICGRHYRQSQSRRKARDELRRALRRPQGGGPEPGHRGALLGHAARPVRRRRGQGGAAGGRLGARARQALRRPDRLRHRGQPRQALDRARPQDRRRTGRSCAGSSPPPTCSSNPSGRAWRPGSASAIRTSRRSTRASSISRSRASARPAPTPSGPAVDTVFQAFTGLMSVNRGLDGIPHRVPVIVMDMATALSNFQAMAVALYARRDEPRGRYIESSLLRGGSTIQAVSMIQHHLEGGQAAAGPHPVGHLQGERRLDQPDDPARRGVPRALRRARDPRGQERSALRHQRLALRQRGGAQRAARARVRPAHHRGSLGAAARRRGSCTSG